MQQTPHKAKQVALRVVAVTSLVVWVLPAASARDRSFLYVVIEGRFEVMAPLCALAPIDGILKTSISANVSRMDRHMHTIEDRLGDNGRANIATQWDGITGMHA